MLCQPIPRSKQIKNKVWELYLLYPIDGASRIALVPDKAIAHTIRICKKPIMAVQTNDAVLLPITFVSWKILREFTYEDNFNNTLR